MVKSISGHDHALIQQALLDARQQTSAHIRVITLPCSASYQAYTLIYGLILGTLTTILLWACGIVDHFLWLISIQLAIVALCDIGHGVSSLFISLVPQRIKHSHAASTAMHDYHLCHDSLSDDEPFVLFFVSLTERYVHVITNPVVHKAFPSDWHKVTDLFSQSIAFQGVGHAASKAVRQISDILAARFPA